MTKLGFAGSLLAPIAVGLVLAMPALAQTAMDRLSPAARSELQKLLPAERAALARQLMAGAASVSQPAPTPAPAPAPAPVLTIAPAAPAPVLTPTRLEPTERPDGNDFLCSSFGCVGGTLLVGAGAYGSETDGSYPDNFGWTVGGNVAAPIPYLAQYGIGAQFAGSYGVYDFGGKVSPEARLANYNEEGFLSFGLFRRPDPWGPWWSRFGLGLAYEVNFNDNAGIFGQTYSLHLWRMKASYAINETHEIGVWAVKHLDTSYCEDCDGGEADRIRALDQLNFFYKYNLASGGSISAYLGPSIDHAAPPPSGFSVAANDHGLRWTAGADANVPVSDYFSVFADVAYGAPDTYPSKGVSNAESVAGTMQSWSALAGLRFYWGGNAHVHEDSGRHWMPYIPDPNNGTVFQYDSQAD